MHANEILPYKMIITIGLEIHVIHIRILAGNQRAIKIQIFLFLSLLH
jgi:hypothetical protein